MSSAARQDRSAASGLNARAADIAAELAELAERGELDAIDAPTLQALTTALVRLYSQKVELQELSAGPVADTIAPTDVVVFVSEAIRVVDVNLFDLAMWHRRADHTHNGRSER